MDSECKKCKYFAELVDTYDDDTKYVCLADNVIQDDYGTAYIYLLLPELYNDINLNCITFKTKK